MKSLFHTAPPWRILPPLLLGLCTLIVTLIYYGGSYRTQVRAEDRFRDIFVGFQSLEGGTELPYRWTKGEGVVCLPAAGATRPLGMLRLDLLGSSFSGIADLELRMAGVSLPLHLAPDHRRYHLLMPPDPSPGPLCLSILSEVFVPENGRVAGIGLRVAEFRPLTPAFPPLAQLSVNLWLSVGGYWLLRRLRVPWWLGMGVVLLPLLLIGVGVIQGHLRVAPNLPFWSGFTALALAAILAALLLYQAIAPRLRIWQRELTGVALISVLLGVGWYELAHLPGYIWPFPLMARGGTVMTWMAIWPTLGAALFIALVLFWLRRETPPHAALVVGSSWLAAFSLPVILKASVRGWDTLFQTFALQEGDYIRDVPLVANDPLAFLRGYVAQMPDLVLHNKTHPPGNTLFLWVVERTFGTGPEPATWVVVAIAALGVWPTYLLARRISGWRAGILAAAIFSLLPAAMAYNVVSMDALLATILAWAIYALYVAFVPTGGKAERAALVAGLLLGLGIFFSFTTLMVALVAAALLVWQLWQRPYDPAALRRWAGLATRVLATMLLVHLGLWGFTGYNSLDAFFMGMANNTVDVSNRISPLGLSSYLFFLAVNAVSYGWFLGPWPLYRLLGSANQAIARLGNPATAAQQNNALGLGMLLLIGGMLGSGLFFREIERIWLFSHILIATTLASGIMDEERGRRTQIILAGLLLTTLFVHSLIFRSILRISW